MKYLGIDWGLTKTGIAFANEKLAEPLVVIREKNVDELVKKIQKIIEQEDITELIVGVSEAEMGEHQEEFAEKLAIATGLRVHLADETLSSRDAQRMSIEAGKKRKTRREMEDAYAAAIMLQRWLDNRE